ncbi:hypothetical protein [Enterobacter hormaechei]|uniref:hypothetical protein n=1 Tax=Enterobacter hormaechei TaxID=158836 RepID=UPI0034D171CC
MAIKIIPDGDADLEAALAAAEAAIMAGTAGVTVERPALIVAEKSADTTGPDSVGYRECEAMICTVECQNGRRGRKIAELQQQYSEQEQALEKTAAQLREVINAHD